MIETLAPIASGLWTDETPPRLIGGRGPDGAIRFPVPGGDAGADYEPVPLSRTGTLWSWTVQRFEPKRPPYDGPVPFRPFMLGYVELPGEVIVETQLFGIDSPRIGMPVQLIIVPFDDRRSTFAFTEAP
jgi:uncharacterized OB-fold protein